jgi:hypothetical protein
MGPRRICTSRRFKTFLLFAKYCLGIKSRRKKWVGQVARMGVRENACTQLKDPGAEERKILQRTLGMIPGHVLDCSTSGQQYVVGCSVHGGKCTVCIKYSNIFRWLRNYSFTSRTLMRVVS